MRRSLTCLLNKSEEKTKENVLTLSEEKFERRLTEEISKLRIEISRVRVEPIKWMFIFWVGQIGAIFAILFTFFK